APGEFGGEHEVFLAECQKAAAHLAPERGPADHHKFFAVQAFDLEPQAAVAGGVRRAAPGAAQRELLASRLAMLVDRARRSASAGSGLRCEPRTCSRTLLSSSSSAFASLRSGVSKPSVNQP